MGWKSRSRRTRSRATRRRGGQRHRAVGELDPRVGDVEMGREQREARGPHLGGLRAAGQVQHQVEVVDHEVEHDGDVGAPGLERRQPLALDVPRSVEIGLGGAKGAIEALDVPHLELHARAAPPRRSGHRPRRAWRRAASPSAPARRARAPGGPTSAWAGVGTAMVTASTRASSASRSSKARRPQLRGHLARRAPRRCRTRRRARRPRACARCRA